MRIVHEEQQATSSSRPFLKKTRKTVWWLLRLPFRMSLRLFFVILVCVLLIIIVETGIWHVPVISPLLYRQPQPTRYVQNMPYSTALLGIAVASAREGSGSTNIPISENQLSSLAQEVNRTDSRSIFSSVQTVIHEERIEIFGNLASRPNVFLTVYIIPSVVDGKIALRAEKIVVGHVPIPKQFAFASVLAYVSDTLTQRLFGNIEVHQITLEDRQLRLDTSFRLP